MGPTERGLEEARRALRGKPGSIDALGEGYMTFARASAVLLDFYKAHPERMRPVTFNDGASLPLAGGQVRPRGIEPTQANAALLAREWLAQGTNTMQTKDADESWAVIQNSDPPNNVGPERVMRLEPFSAYDLLSDVEGDGGWLVKHANIVGNTVGMGNGAAVNTGGRTMDRMALARQFSGRQRVARELTSYQLQEINRQNREGWKGR